MLFYRYCIQLKRPEPEFFKSSLSKIIKIISIANEEATIKAKVLNNEPFTPHYFAEKAEVITSMKEVQGFV